MGGGTGGGGGTGAGGVSGKKEGKKKKKKEGKKGKKERKDQDDGPTDPPIVCNTINPDCGLTAMEAQLQYLTSYDDLRVKLQDIVSRSKIPIRYGPLIENGNNDGLFDIDVPLARGRSTDYDDEYHAAAAADDDDHHDEVRNICEEFPDVRCDICGETNWNPTIREAVVCTVTQSDFPLRGNTDLNQVGKTTRGRDLVAVLIEGGGEQHGHGRRKSKREGRRRPTNVMVTTQLHGNEPGGTEGALAILETLTQKSEDWVHDVLDELDQILLIMRVNVDAGEPSGNNLGENYPGYLTGQLTTSTLDYGFWRQNHNPLAGGAFGVTDGNPFTEPDFFGIVGRGYNLNRYNFAALDQPIRPVESQAIVATMHAFRPTAVFDMHGDVQKNTCTLDLASIIPGGFLGVLPTALCLPPSPPAPTITTAREYMVEGSVFAKNTIYEEGIRLAEKISTEIYRALDPKVVGSIQRFSQIQTGSGSLNDGEVGTGSERIGSVGLGCEVSNFATEPRPAVLSVDFPDGSPNIGIDTGLIEPCHLPDHNCLHEQFLMHALIEMSKYLNDDDVDANEDSGFCDMPYTHNVPGTLPFELGWGPLSTTTPTNVPGGGQLLIPVQIDGFCPDDPA